MNTITQLVAGSVLVVLLSFRTHADAQPQDQAMVDESFTLVSFVDLDYPPIARAAGIQGVVVIAATLDDNGNVVAATAITGSRGLVEDAAANAKKWKFKPNRQQRVIIVYDFQIESGACHDRRRSLFQLKHPNFAIISSCENVIEG